MAKAPATPCLHWDEAALAAWLDAQGADEAARAAVRSLSRDGFAVIDLAPDAAALCDPVVADMTPYFADPKVSRVQDLWRRSDPARRLAVHPQVLRLLALAFGRKAFAFQTLNFQVGTQQALHSDTVHFSSRPHGFMCGVWFALEDVQADAGPVQYVAGTHKLPILTMAEAGVGGRRAAVEDYESRYLPALHARLTNAPAPTPALLKKGQALIWAANLVHGGSPISRSGATRRSMVAHYYFRDCLYYTPLMSNEPADDLFVRVPQNVADGRFVWPRREGRLAVPALRTLINALYERRRRVVHALY